MKLKLGTYKVAEEVPDGDGGEEVRHGDTNKRPDEVGVAERRRNNEDESRGEGTGKQDNGVDESLHPLRGAQVCHFEASHGDLEQGNTRVSNLKEDKKTQRSTYEKFAKSGERVQRELSPNQDGADRRPNIAIRSVVTAGRRLVHLPLKNGSDDHGEDTAAESGHDASDGTKGNLLLAKVRVDDVVEEGRHDNL